MTVIVGSLHICNMQIHYVDLLFVNMHKIQNAYCLYIHIYIYIYICIAYMQNANALRRARRSRDPAAGPAPHRLNYDII